MADAEVKAAREKLRQKFGDGGGRIGGKGTVRRKKKVVHKAAAADDKRLQATLKRLNVNPIPGIEEVNLYKEDNTVIHFDNPKVQASLQSNTYVISGTSTTKSVSAAEMAMAASGMDKKFLEQLSKTPGGIEKLLSQLGGMPAPAGDDDAPPELEADFEATSESA